MHVSRTTVDVDQDALEAAPRRYVLAGFDVTRDIDGTPTEVEANRSEEGSGPHVRER